MRLIRRQCSDDLHGADKAPIAKSSQQNPFPGLHTFNALAKKRLRIFPRERPQETDRRSALNAIEQHFRQFTDPRTCPLSVEPNDFYQRNSFASSRRLYPSSTCTTRIFFIVIGESWPIGIYTMVREKRAAMLRNTERGGFAATYTTYFCTE